MYVGGLPYGVRERDLERFFKGYGRTRDILLKNGYGFVVSTNINMLIFIFSTIILEGHTLRVIKMPHRHVNYNKAYETYFVIENGLIGLVK